MTQEAAAAEGIIVPLWAIFSFFWSAISIAVFWIGMHKRRKRVVFPYVVSNTILWPLIALVQVITHILPAVRATIAFVPKCFRGIRTFSTILIEATGVTLRGGIPELPEKIHSYHY